MGIPELTGKVQTVLGPILPEELGVTLPHEHIVCDGTCWFVEPSDATAKAMAHHPVTLDILWWLRYHFFQNWDDLQLLDEQEGIDEMLRFKYAGGNSIVELSSIGLGRNPMALARIGMATGLNVIMGSGYYIAASHGPDMDAKTEEEIAEEIVRDITEGVGKTDIRAGIIGEIGASWPITKNELKSLRAAARAQRITGAPLNVHPGQHEGACMEIVRILEDAGADLTRTVLDRGVLESNTHLARYLEQNTALPLRRLGLCSHLAQHSTRDASQRSLPRNDRYHHGAKPQAAACLCLERSPKLADKLTKERVGCLYGNARKINEELEAILDATGTIVKGLLSEGVMIEIASLALLVRMRSTSSKAS